MIRPAKDVWICLGLFAAALLVRQLVFPQLDDPAFYLKNAHHLAAGRRFVIDTIWNYFLPFDSVTHAGHEF